MTGRHAGGMKLQQRRVLLIIGGGIAAYKALELIRRLRDEGARVRCVMTAAATQFVTPLSAGTLSGDRVFTDLFDRNDEHDVGHIRLSREADLVVVAPATADLMAKLATGAANDLASAVLLASDKPVLMAPAMNPRMWAHPATRRNRETLEGDGVRFVGPNSGAMAESGEAGEGRMAEPGEIVAAVVALLGDDRPLAGRTFLVTSGPTHEPIDPVRYIANRSSGKQGHAIAAALAGLGAQVRLISGPVALPDPAGVTAVHVETAQQMMAAVEQVLPVDGAVFVAAVADWRVAEVNGEKIKKAQGASRAPALTLIENPDILATIGHHPQRPAIVVGFAAETENLVANARAKLARKGADIIVANDVSPASDVMGGDRNRVTLISAEGAEEWPELDKVEVAERLARLIVERLDR
jgi:phosphopantothenoylcysteine decarboxylase / phosphopantothenate---cysteine ligase